MGSPRRGEGRERKIDRINRCARLVAGLTLRAMVTARQASNSLQFGAVTRFCCLFGVLHIVACSASDEPIRIGLAGPFSQQTGQSMRRAAQLAVAEINQGGGVGGRQFQLVVRDDSGSANVAVRVAQSLYDNRDVVAVIGHMGSAATTAAARIYNGGDNPLVSISPSASTTGVTEAGPYTFRVCPDDRVHGARLAEWSYQQLDARRVAILYANDAYGRGLRTAFKDRYTELGGQIVAEDPFLPILPGFEPYLTRIRLRGGADAILLGGDLNGAERMLGTLNSIGFDLTVLGGDGIAGIESSDIGAEGVYVSLAYVYDQPGKSNAAFRSAYQRTYEDQLPDYRGAATYDIVYLLSRVIEQVGRDRSKIRDYLAGVGTETEPYEGITGQVVFDSSGSVVDRNVVIGVVRNNRLVSAERR
jgi:branched-chain amino acid transport system substrate-binding protein